MKRKAVAIALAAVCAVGFPATLWVIFYKAPLLDVLYFNQKIFYYHVPSAWMLFVSVFIAGIAAVGYLRTRRPAWDEVAEVGVEMAVLFGSIVLVTGSIWGKAAWNVWWQWDARLTSFLLLWLVMVACLLVRRYGGPGSERLAAGLALFGMVDVPLIYFSVKIWRTIHPDTTVVPGLRGWMRVGFWGSILLYFFVYAVLFRARLGLARTRRSLVEMRERAVDAGLFD